MKQKEISMYIEARQSLIKLRDSLRVELAEVENSLRDEAASPEPTKRERSPIGTRKGGSAATRVYGSLTCKIKEALATGPKTKREVVSLLTDAGFVFGGPALKVVDSVIYTKHFVRSGKLFANAT